MDRPTDLVYISYILIGHWQFISQLHALLTLTLRFFSTTAVECAGHHDHDSVRHSLA